ncbi:glycoside hydrolase family 15 protein [Frankia gtarii]|uniref:glycoside hydrolase family 15 protein n=1 Tax=Frankia gtarii TaxID=2950102 RepID=UPI0021C22791|nr:glycoside hydrolase family 15 protein [Frankia gtarii]
MPADPDRSDLSGQFPPHVLRDYAFLGDGERGAVVGPDGDLAWMCAPSWDSDAVFATLIGGAGCYAVTPVGRYSWGGHYDHRSLIWNGRWVTTDGIVECRDALALPADPHTAVILRRIRVLSGSAQIRVVLDVRAGYGLADMDELALGGEHAARHDRLDADGWRAAEAAVDAIRRRGGEPDAGIWEIDPERWAHSRLTCVSGLRTIAAHAPARQAARCNALAEAILTDVRADCLHPDGRWQRSPGDPRIDAALLLPALRGALPADDPRSRAAVAAVEAELVRDDYVYRFPPDGGGPLGEEEGAFLLCGFLLALARHAQGDHIGARALFERGRASCGSPGLFAEEFDVDQRQLRGNLPQAFVHALLLECAAVIAPGEKQISG